MYNRHLFTDSSAHLDTNKRKTKESAKDIYQIMHKNKIVASISTTGKAFVYLEQYMPYDLYFEEDDDIDTRVNNLNVFYHWCASRVLSLDRKYAKVILNSIGMPQAITDKDRAKISLSYHCVSLTDVFWVRNDKDKILFEQINIYNNPLNEALVDLTLKGHQMSVTNKELQELAPDLSTKGCFSKAWIRKNGSFVLLKDGGTDVVKREILASRICQCFDFKQVRYSEYFYDGEPVTQSEIVTSIDYSIVSKAAFDIYAVNHDLDTIEICKEIDPETFYGMNILDYLIGNTDRHEENWGFLVENKNNHYISLYPLMDFNQCFLSYDTLDGAGCLTLRPLLVSQREAAIEAVKQIGLRQICEIEPEWFDEMIKEAEMFQKRLNELKKYEK